MSAGLRDALYHVQRCGYDAVDHTVIDFPPVEAALPPDDDFEAHMRHFEFGRRPGRVFPYKFLAKHYPVRL